MDQSTRRLPDPVAGTLQRERRRCVRQKLHTPVYASFNGPETGMVVDLSELLDLHEEGFAVQTGERLETNRAVSICLDLPETRSYVHGTGQVIWSDDTGRGGIKFSSLLDDSRQNLKQWLFANLLIASANHAARTQQLAHRYEEKLPEPVPDSQSNRPSVIPDRNERLSSLEMVRREVRDLVDNAEAVFELIAERALSLTGASGAGLALLTDGQMICRARAGNLAPPLGAPVDVNHGLSGECVRSGLIVSCDDTGSDPRVDPEIGRCLGIGSLMAAPIFSDFKVIGLLEIFSPHPRTLTQEHGHILDRLGEMIPKTYRGKTRSEGWLANAEMEVPPLSPQTPLLDDCGESVALETTCLQPTDDAAFEPKVEAIERPLQKIPLHAVSAKVPRPDPAPVHMSPARLIYHALLGLAIAVVAMVVGYLVGPMIQKRLAASSPASTQSLSTAIEPISRVSGQSPRDRTVPVRSVADLQKLADRGAADAQWQLAIRYHNGEGLPQDDTQAMKWFERAAEQGHVDAQSHLGAYYWAGRGVPENLSKAYFWSSIAMAQGDEISKARLEGLASQMTREQVSVARQQAEIWIHEHGFARTARN